MKRAMAVQAEAERNRRAVIIQSQGELSASENLMNTAENLAKSSGALHLRTLQTIRDIAADPSEKIVLFLPSELNDVVSTLAGKRGADVILENHQRYLQIAFNYDRAMVMCLLPRIPFSERLMIEAGTPYIKREGLAGIRLIRNLWRGIVVADIKVRMAPSTRCRWSTRLARTPLPPSAAPPKRRSTSSSRPASA